LAATAGIGYGLSAGTVGITSATYKNSLGVLLDFIRVLD